MKHGRRDGSAQIKEVAPVLAEGEIKVVGQRAQEGAVLGLDCVAQLGAQEGEALDCGEADRSADQGANCEVDLMLEARQAPLGLADGCGPEMDGPEMAGMDFAMRSHIGHVSPPFSPHNVL